MNPPQTSRDDFAPTAAWDVLRLRAGLLQRIRAFFDEHGFLEVETPLLSHDTVIDRHLDPLAVTLPADPRWPETGRRLWLQTSPEFGMKRLLACGATAIYQITRSFRGGERGRLHNPEFTIVEWYRVGDGMREGIQLLAELAERTLGRGSAELLTYADAFDRFAGVDPYSAEIDVLRRAAESRGIVAPASFGADRDAWLDLLLTEVVEPRFDPHRPLILYDYPASQAALARVRFGTPPVAERFELYAGGLELANGYHELLDADELRARNTRVNRQRREDGKPQLPEDSRLLAAMQHGLPACCGVAIGFDRMVMVAAGAATIDEVMAFPIERA